MLPVVRLNRIAFRAASLASQRLDALVLPPSSNQASTRAGLTSSSVYQQSIIKEIENLESALQSEKEKSSSANTADKKEMIEEPLRNLSQIFEKLAALKENQLQQLKINRKYNEESGEPDPETAEEKDILSQNLQEASFLATYTHSLILQLYNLGVKDRTLWLQLKSLALQVCPYASSSALVNMLECLSRKAVCGSLECKAFQLQLGNDIAALPSQDILRFIAACQLCGTPLQKNVVNVIADQGLRWIDNANSNCSLWWVLADVADQLPPSVRRTIVYHLVYAIEKIRTANTTNSNANNNHVENPLLKQIWLHHDKDTTFILWRLRTKGTLSLMNNVPKEFNPAYSDALLKSIRVDRLPTARSSIFLLRALCLGIEDLSETAKLVAEDVCRLVYNNVIENRIQSHFLLRTIVHSVANEQMRIRVPTALRLGVEASLHYMRNHSHHITNETTCCVLNILISLQESRTNTILVDGNGNNNDNNSGTTDNNSLSEAQLVKRLQQSMRRLILISSPEDLLQLMSLTNKIGILEYESAKFALELIQQSCESGGKVTMSVSATQELQKAQGIVRNLAEKEGISSERQNNRKKQSSSSSLSAASSLVSNWSEIRSLPAPKIAFYAASAAKQMYDNNATSSSAFLTNATVVAPISSLISQSAYTNPSSGSTSLPGSGGVAVSSWSAQTTSSSTNSDGGLFSLCSAESEIVSHHKGLSALSAKDCATLVGATSVLPSESKSLVLRVVEQGTSSYLSRRNDSILNENSQEKSSASRLTIQLRDQKEGKSSKLLQQQLNDDPISQNGLFRELQSTVLFLEAQCSINTALELNSGVDSAIFTSAQRRITKFMQMAFPPPFEYNNNPLWIDCCGRFVSAIALHRLSTFRLPLWLMNVFCTKYCRRSSATLPNHNNNNNINSPFRTIRALHACCYFGIDDKQAIDGLVKSFCKVDQELFLYDSVSARALFQILRSLPHVISSNKQLEEFIDKAAKPAVESWLKENTDKITAAKQGQQEQATKTPENSNNNNQNSVSTTETHQVSALRNPNFFKGGFGSGNKNSSSLSNSSPTYLTTAERRQLFDVLCCAAALDLPPVTYKTLIEHLHPFDTGLYPLHEAMFFFGHAAQKKRLSGFSLRVWRSLTMQLDKVTLTPYSSSLAGGTGSSNGTSTVSTQSSSMSETLSSSSSSAGSSSFSSSMSSGCCGLPLIQSSMIVPPTLLSLAYYISYGGGSSAIDNLLDKVRRFGPFEPLLLAKVIRIALAPAGVKTRPSLSQLVCRSLDATVVEAFSTNDLVMLMEVFHKNQAQRVTVGLIQADAIVTLAQEALASRIVGGTSNNNNNGDHHQNISDELFMRIASIPCSSSIPARYVTCILIRLLNIAKANGGNVSSSQDVSSSTVESNIVIRDRHIFTPIVFSYVVSHIANVKSFHSSSKNVSSSDENDETQTTATMRDEDWAMENPAEFWEEIKSVLLEPLQPHLKGADKEAMDELLSL